MCSFLRSSDGWRLLISSIVFNYYLFHDLLFPLCHIWWKLLKSKKLFPWCFHVFHSSLYFFFFKTLIVIFYEAAFYLSIFFHAYMCYVGLQLLLKWTVVLHEIYQNYRNYFILVYAKFNIFILIFNATLEYI